MASHVDPEAQPLRLPPAGIRFAGVKQLTEIFLGGSARPDRPELDIAGTRAGFRFRADMTDSERADRGAIVQDDRVSEFLRINGTNLAREVEAFKNGRGELPTIRNGLPLLVGSHF